MFALDVQMSGRPTPALWDLVSGLLYQFHSQGIEEGEEPAPQGAAALVAANEFELAIEPGVLAPPERFTAYFENRRHAEHAGRAIEPHIAALKPAFVIREVVDKNYAELFRESFQPIEVPPCWLVKASWHKIKARKGTIELLIEPGMAFGTGTHETTRGCLEFLAAACSKKGFKPRSAAAKSAEVLDFGCGSGILAVALKKLGVGRVLAVDIDPLALDATELNAKANGVKVEVSAEIKGLKNLDGIVANILKNTLLDFAPSFRDMLKTNGFLILSGLLSEQEETILERYRAFGFKSIERQEQNGWVTLWLEKA